MSIAQKTVDVLLDSDVNSDEMADEIYTTTRAVQAERMYQASLAILTAEGNYWCLDKWHKIFETLGLLCRGSLAWGAAAVIAVEVKAINDSGKSVDDAVRDFLSSSQGVRMNFLPYNVTILKRLLDYITSHQRAALPVDKPW